MMWARCHRHLVCSNARVRVSLHLGPQPTACTAYIRIEPDVAKARFDDETRTVTAKAFGFAKTKAQPGPKEPAVGWWTERSAQEGAAHHYGGQVAEQEGTDRAHGRAPQRTQAHHAYAKADHQKGAVTNSTRPSSSKPTSAHATRSDPTKHSTVVPHAATPIGRADRRGGSPGCDLPTIQAWSGTTPHTTTA